MNKKLFIKNNSYFFFFVAIKEEKVSKKKNYAIVSYNLTVVDKMDVAGKPALSRSLKNARGVNIVHLMKIIMSSNGEYRVRAR